jgi:hypothetical protein
MKHFAHNFRREKETARTRGALISFKRRAKDTALFIVETQLFLIISAARAARSKERVTYGELE